jgi:dipeptidyl aminopeptidase/acylaminoacyl peptidase
MMPNFRAYAFALPVLLAAGSRAADPPGALPYDLAFARRSFLWEMSLAVSPDGGRVAYEVAAPPDSNLGADRYQQSGTPSSVVGSRVYVTDQPSGRTSDFCPGGSCWRPVWSPDGKSMAFYSDSGGAPHLWIRDMASGEARCVADAVIKPKLWTGDEVHWSADGGTIYVPLAPTGIYHSPTRPKGKQPLSNAAGVTVLRSGSETTATVVAATDSVSAPNFYKMENLVAIGAVDVKTGATRTIVSSDVPSGPAAFRLSASGKWLSYISVWREKGDTSQAITMDLVVVPAAGGTPITIVRNLPSPERDYFGTTYSWSPSGDRLVYFQDAKLWMVDLSTGTPTAPTQILGALGPLAPNTFWYTRDGSALVVGTDPVDDKEYGDPRPRSITVAPLGGGPAARCAVDDAKWTIRNVIKADERTVWQPDGSSLNIVVDERATGHRAVLRCDPRTGQSRTLWNGLANLDNLTGGGHQEFLFGTYEDYRTPPDVYRFSPDLATKIRLSHIEPRLDSVAIGTTEIFETTIPLYDGKLATVRTAVLLPRGAKRGDKLPGIVTMYPGSDMSKMAARFGGGNVFSLPNLIFTSRGYAMIIADLKLGPNREAGNPMQEMTDAILPQIYHAADLGYVDVSHLALVGQSYGGYGTASIVSRTNLFRAAVPISGIYDLPGIYGEIKADGSDFWMGWSEGGQARMGTHPWANERRYLDNSPYYQADKIFTPVLIVHGTADDAYTDGQKLFAALRRLGRPAQLASYEGQGHVVSEWRLASAVDAAHRMVEFLRLHLGEPPEHDIPHS